MKKINFTFKIMLPKKKIEWLAEYWIKSSREDLKTMEALYKSRRYDSCLFWGHLVLEKILKALVVIAAKEQAPRTHNLPYLAKLAHLDLSGNEAVLLDDVDTFNIRTRYPDEKFEFFKKCTKPFADRYVDRIIFLYKKLCQKASSKK